MEKWDNGYYFDHMDFKWHNFIFNAVLHQAQTPNRPYLCRMEKDAGGRGYFDTQYLTRQCGLAAHLLNLSMLDDDINANGGVNVKENNLVGFQNAFDQDWDTQKEAYEHCEIVYFCHAIPEQPKAGIGYLRAGIKAGYNILYTHRGLVDPTKFDKMETTLAGQRFEKGAVEFYNKYGRFWFFCKWKSDMWSSQSHHTEPRQLK